MGTFETSATVLTQGRVLVAGVPFAPGTEVEVAISPKPLHSEEAALREEEAWAAARARMKDAFETVQGFKNIPRFTREELYDREHLP